MSPVLKISPDLAPAGSYCLLCPSKLPAEDGAASRSHLLFTLQLCSSVPARTGPGPAGLAHHRIDTKRKLSLNTKLNYLVFVAVNSTVMLRMIKFKAMGLCSLPIQISLQTTCSAVCRCRCVEGGVRLAQDRAVTVCGQNERFSPPVVLFR